jgi:putative autoinducer-2 (AI-2) aldolase
MGVGEGAAGVDMGRNVFQSINPSAMLHALSLVVHENYTGERAYEVFCESAVLPKT